MLRSCNQPDRWKPVVLGNRRQGEDARAPGARTESAANVQCGSSRSRRVEQRREDLGREYMNVQCVPLGPGYVTAADIIQSNDDTCRVTP
jgi:hypothetical protein